ncbi:melanocyte-stimulating hormone receptor-like [Hydractinia symbiolongicarpus]|uniref:melanocyte-stimulating hormone receptor-like n=1 Tax=Hydractinia symbiolongicarpus TaxID=13093 RepID=UPI00254EFDED|nr:melanocyte-stimulating hormone receptor-like [Hydractinia symbiolongicarpus]
MYINTTSKEHYQFNCAVTYNDYALHDGFKTNLLVAAASAISLILPITVLNILIITAIVRVRRLNTPANFLLANTAVCDLLVGCVSIPLYTTVLLLAYHKTHNCVLFTIEIITVNIFGMMSFLTVTIITVDRYMAIFKPFAYHEKILVNKRIYKYIMTVLWIFIVGFVNLASLLPYYDLIFYVQTPVAIFALLACTYIYIRIYRTVKNIRTKTRRSTRERRYTVVTFGMLVSLIIFYMPYLIVSAFWVLYPYNTNDMLYATSPWLFTIIAAKSLVNPLLYCFTLKSVRTGIKRVCGCRRNDHDRSSSKWDSNFNSTFRISRKFQDIQEQQQRQPQPQQQQQPQTQTQTQQQPQPQQPQPQQQTQQPQRQQQQQ